MIEYQRQEEIERIQNQGFLVKVVGVGGAGSNVLDQLAMDGMDDAQLELICMNTDVRTLKTSTAHAKVQIGKQLTRGLGAGGDPELGILASEEAEEEIRSVVRGQHMVFICTGIGGGTGSGAAPTVSRIAKEEGAFVVVFATMPFSFEGRRRIQQAETALKLLERSADALITFENDRMGELVLPKEGIQQAFANADQIIGQSVRAITNVVTQPGLIQIGMDDLLTALKTPVSRCLFGYGEAKGKNRAQEALKQALRSPLLDRGKLLGKSRNALVHVVGGPSMSLFEVESLMNEMSKNVGNETQILFGAATDEKMDDRLSVTIISSLTLDELRSHQSVAAQQEADTPEPTTIEADVSEDNVADEQEAEEAARQQAEQEALAQRAAEEEAARQQEEEEARQQAEAEEAARHQAEAEEAARQQAEEEEAARQRAAEEEEARANEEAARQKAEEEEAARVQAETEEAARREAEEQAAAQQQAAEEEGARVQAEEAAAKEAEEASAPVSSTQSRRARLRDAKADEATASVPDAASESPEDQDGERARREAFHRRREELRRKSGKGRAVAQEEPQETVAQESAAPAASQKQSADDLMAQRRRAQEELKRKREELERLLKLEDEAKSKPASPALRRATATASEEAEAEAESSRETEAPSDLEPTQRIPIQSGKVNLPERKGNLTKPKRAPKSRAGRSQESAAPAASRGSTPAGQSDSSQAELQLEPLRGRFEKAAPTLVDGENLDVPTFFRKRGRKG